MADQNSIQNAGEVVREEIVSYETRLSVNAEWALSEGGKFFGESGAVHETLREVARRLEEGGVPYAVLGGLALFYHGFRRFTEDVDLLTTKEGLRAAHELLDGLGYLPPFAGSKHLRDKRTGVKIEFIAEGEFPGDGLPNPVTFPDPADVSELFADIRIVNLPTLIALKLASGMTGGLVRLKDFADVIALIRIKELPREFAGELNPYVREKYLELWDGIKNSPAGIDRETP